MFYVLETKTSQQRENELWNYSQTNKITHDNAHKILIRERNFETLAESILKVKKVSDQLAASVKDAFIHEKTYKPIAAEKYLDILKFHLNRDAERRESGCVIQPNLYWLVASPVRDW